MGEVYRADDLKLGQAVALTFLPAIVENDAGRLQRFLNEVKIARQISHPNVCRRMTSGRWTVTTTSRWSTWTVPRHRRTVPGRDHPNSRVRAASESAITAGCLRRRSAEMA